MQYFIRKIFTFVGVALSALTTFAGNGTLNSPFTVQEAFEQRDALAKSQQEVVLKADFLGFGNSRQTMTADYKEGDYFLVGTAEHQIIVRGTNYIQALQWADATSNWVMHGYFAHENNDYVFVAEDLDGAYHAVIGKQGIGAFAAKANFIVRNPSIKLYAPRIANKERKFITAEYPAQTTVAGTPNGYTEFLLKGNPGTYNVTLTSHPSNIKITSTILQAGTTQPTLKNRTFYKFVATDDKVGFEIGENQGQQLTLARPTEVYLALNALQIGILKEVLKLEDTNFISLTPQTLTAVRSLSSNNHSDTTVVYDLNGRKVGTVAQLHSLPKGVYIINGKKVLNH
jgi:hypothetical protein